MSEGLVVTPSTNPVLKYFAINSVSAVSRKNSHKKKGLFETLKVYQIFKIKSTKITPTNLDIFFYMPIAYHHIQ